MFYSSHGNLTVDTWRVSTTQILIDNFSSIESLVITQSNRALFGDSDLIPTIAGFAAVATVYAAAGALAVADGPLPFGDAIAVGLLAIPDYAIYAFGYSLFD